MSDFVVVKNKLDAWLQGWIKEKSLTEEPIPLVIECGDQLHALDRVAESIAMFGGEVRHLLPRLNMIVASIPGSLIVELAESSDVAAIGVEEEFKVAV